ncbi:hypothetical protein [Iodidimonas gelatinilytica]|uniref:hypothetical protein n=1 Tax=Iodidimonas gelatinilytica TaxID=1236966 RepID=UPI0012309F0A|nr:hypothetical protein [Iodidimonas gelatinilytica]
MLCHLRIVCRLWIFGLALILGLAEGPIGATPGLAQAPNSLAQSAFDEGRWRDAVRLGAMPQDPLGMAIAAQAELMSYAYSDDLAAQSAAVDRAVFLADAAKVLAPHDPFVLLQGAAAYGFRAQLNRSRRDAHMARQLIDAALWQAPDNAYAQAALGFWHGRTVLGAGSFAARMVFDARRSSAIEAFEKALALDPDNLVIRSGYAQLLVRFGKNAHRSAALGHLRWVVAASARTALERHMQENAQLLLAAQDAGADPKALKQLADDLAPFSDSSAKEG